MARSRMVGRFTFVPGSGIVASRAVNIGRAWMTGRSGLVLGIAIVSMIVMISMFAPLLGLHDPFEQDLMQRLLPPFWMEGSDPSHWLGTDQLGRDYMARLVYGGRISLLIGISATLTSGLIGTTLGVAGGYFGGRIDELVLFTITTRLALPAVLVALSIVGLVGSSLAVVVGTLGFLLWDRFAVVARTTTMQVRDLDYVKAARAAGCSVPWIVCREILPNITDHLLVVATLEVALAILSEATLSFLGLGVPPPLPSWGLMISEGKDFMFFSAWMIVLPGAAMALLVLGINLLGDGLRDVLHVGRTR